MIGAMAMPADFKYRSVFLKGKPQHRKYDDFWIRHPPMPPSHWAKIFAPFDALAGFDEAISGKEIRYCERKSLSEGETEELNRKLCSLTTRTKNRSKPRLDRPAATITFFSPCTDVNSEWYGTGGQYKTVSGIISRVDPVITRSITVNDQTIWFEDIISINTDTDSPDA